MSLLENELNSSEKINSLIEEAKEDALSELDELPSINYDATLLNRPKEIASISQSQVIETDNRFASWDDFNEESDLILDDIKSYNIFHQWDNYFYDNPLYFDDDWNINLGIYTLSNGFQFAGIVAGGDEENPLFTCLYLQEDGIHEYTPLLGNHVDTKTMHANEYNEDVEILFNENLLIADIENHFNFTN